MENELISAVVNQMPLENITEFNPFQQVVQPVIDNLAPLLLKISLIIGGIFGVYLIYILIMLYYEKKRITILKDIRFDLDQINEHYGLKTSQDNINGLRKLFRKIMGKKEEPKTKKKEK